MSVKSEKIYSPQNYLAAITGNCYILRSDTISDMIEEISTILLKNGFENLWDYGLSEIEHLVENDLDVVLVELTGSDANDEWTTIYRWFEVPDKFNCNE